MFVRIDSNVPDLTINELPDYLILLAADQTVLLTSSPEGFTAQTTYNGRDITIVAIGTSLVYSAQGGELQLAGGTELSFDIYVDGGFEGGSRPDAQFSLDHFTVDGLLAAIAQEDAGADLFAVETLMMSGPLSLSLSYGNDVMSPDTFWGGANFQPDAASVIYLRAGNDVYYDGDRGTLVFGGRGGDLIYGDGGEDSIFGSYGPDTIFGGGGRDFISGGGQGDLIRAGQGNDFVSGGSGSNILYGGTGHDSIQGGTGNDFIVGGDGEDSINGYLGADVILGGRGNDSVNGSSGRDTIFGGIGDDVLTGANGRDMVFGGLGNDRIGGSRDSDILMGGLGDDQIWGGLHRDALYGGSGENILNGQGGFDQLYAGRGTNIMTGGTGADDFIFSDRSGRNIITDFEAGRGSEDIILRNVSEITSYDDLITNHIWQDGENVVIESGSGLVITLENINLGDLGVHDFIF